MTEARLNAELIERVVTILRRDLKLGPDAQVDAGTPLMGGDFELDSLDMVMLVTSVEKEFGVKFAETPKSQQAFETVGSLVRFLEQQQSSGETPASVAQPSRAAPHADLAQQLAGLPHDEPFRFVTRLTELVPMGHGCGEWQLSGDEDFFAGHFPNRPIVPGVLISEALAQLSGLVGAPPSEAQPTDGTLAHVDVRFRRVVSPPTTLVLHSRFSGSVDAIQQFEVRAEQAGEVVAAGRLSLKRGA